MFYEIHKCHGGYDKILYFLFPRIFIAFHYLLRNKRTIKNDALDVIAEIDCFYNATKLVTRIEEQKRNARTATRCWGQGRVIMYHIPRELCETRANAYRGVQRV